MPDALEPISRVRVRAGRELAVVDVSSHGVLVEGEGRLLPGTHLEVHVHTSTGRTLVRSRVVRAFVVGVSSDRVIYRGALAFEHIVDVVPPSVDGNAVPGRAPDGTPGEGSGYPWGVG